MENEPLKTGDSRRAVIETYSDIVYRLAYSMVKSRFDADDIHQEVFMRYLRKEPLFQNEENEKAWFLRVTVNCCKNYWKSAWVRKVTGFIKEESAGVFEMEERDQELIETVKQLPEKYRIVVHLFYYEDMSAEEISRAIGVKPATVRTQLTRARSMLKKRLGGMDDVCGRL